MSTNAEVDKNCIVRRHDDSDVHIYCYPQQMQLDGGEIPLAGDVTADKICLHLIEVEGKIVETSFSNLKEVTHIVLFGCNLTEAIFPELPKIYYLEMIRTILPTITKETFKNLKGIKRMEIDENEAEIQDGAFDGLENLEFLTFFKQNINFSKDFLKGLNNLKELSMEYAGIETVPEDSFKETPELKILNLDGNSIEYLAPGTLEPLQNLEEFYVTLTNLKSFDINLLKEQKNLKALGIPVRTLKSVNFKKLFELCPKLGTIRFMSNDVECPEVKDLEEQFKKDNIQITLTYICTTDLKTC
ncbi:leucine-rich repeat-containing G-protein coupled receptor 4-like isoform X4 [Diabrotica virgifera virgifera]|nr:leucine-rich repeat-containing G-protein coupled receptor 4-like isoform X4 [Diabrotica virgifera virgifera]